MYTCIQVCAHTQSPSQHTHTHTHKHTHSLTTHTHTHMYSLITTSIHTYIHHTHTRKHRTTHTQSLTTSINLFHTHIHTQHSTHAHPYMGWWASQRRSQSGRSHARFLRTQCPVLRSQSRVRSSKAPKSTPMEHPTHATPPSLPPSQIKQTNKNKPGTKQNEAKRNETKRR